MPDATVTETTETEEAQTEPRASDPTPASQSNGVGGSDDFHEQYLGEETRIEGMVKRWNQERGYGFLTPKMPDGEFCKDGTFPSIDARVNRPARNEWCAGAADKNDIFVHQSAVQLDGYRALLETEEAPPPPALLLLSCSSDDGGHLPSCQTANLIRLPVCCRFCPYDAQNVNVSARYCSYGSTWTSESVCGSRSDPLLVLGPDERIGSDAGFGRCHTQ